MHQAAARHGRVDESSATQKARDLVNGLDGDYMNVFTDVPGKVGSAKVFTIPTWDPANQYVQIPYSPLLDMGTGDFSIDAWIKRDYPASFLVRPQPIFCHETGELGNYDPSFGYTFEIMNNHVALEMTAA